MMGSYSAPEIYNLVTGGPGLDPLFNGQDFTSGQANFQATINQQVIDLNSAMNQYWQGNAADQAVSGAAPLVSATDAANQSLTSASATIGSQADAFSVVSTTVVPMAPSAPSNNVGNQIVSFFGANTQLDQQIAQYQTDSNTNVQAYNAYNSASAANAAAMPTDYGTLPNATPTFTVTAQNASVGSGPGFSGSAGATGGAGSSGGKSFGSSGAGAGGGSTGGRTSPSGTTNTTRPSGTSGSGTSGSGTGSTTTSGDSPTTLEDFNPGGTDTGTVSPYDESLYGPGGISGGGLNSRDDSTNKNNQYAGGGGLFGNTGGGGFGGGGEGLGGGGGAGGLGGGTGSEGQGNRAGIGNMTPGSEEAMSRAAAGAAGEPGLAAGRGQGKKGEEDAEHQTAEYLQEADPDAIFGTDQLTVPPVIE